MPQKPLAQPPKQRKQTNKQPRISAAEKRRLQRLTQYELAARVQGFRVIAGIDEAGRGPLAGPVVAAACIVPADRFLVGINDSKLLTPKQREKIFNEISADPEIQFSIGVIPSEEIDRINILQATIAAMKMAIKSLVCLPDLLLVDGMHIDHEDIPCQKIVQGDCLSQSIAAASVIAKETRDRMMREYHQMWPQYGFDQHKGYGTEEHLAALASHGPCPIHRRSFKPVNVPVPVPVPEI